MKQLFYFLLVLMIPILTNAQTKTPYELVQEQSNFVTVDLFTKTNQRNDIQLPKEVGNSYEIFNLDPANCKTLFKSRNQAIIMPITIDGKLHNMKLSEVDLPGYTVRTAPNNAIAKYTPGKHYRGVMADDAKTIVALSVFENEVMGLIIPSKGDGQYVLGKLANSDKYIVYKDNDVAAKLATACSTEDTNESYHDHELSDRGGQRALTDCVRLYFEVDYDIYQNKGSSVAATTDYVTGLYNQVATLYSVESINTTISEIKVWTQASPYNGTTSLAMLNAFTANTEAFNGDIAMLLSFKASGGIAYVNGLCSSILDYRKSFSSIASTYQNVPTYSWSVMVVTHEFGHLLGSQHTHACVWNGNNTAIDGCYTTEGGCASPAIPSGGGTIMSYCHLTNVGINLNNGFGPQPGSIIRTRVTNATCLSACGPPPPPPGPCTQISANLTLVLDNYPAETTWQIRTSSGTVLYSGGPYSTANATVNIALCQPAGCYNFVINDSYGDGICCAYGNGSYQITSGGTTLFSGGQFTSTITHNFCLGSSAPTCTDGIQNGQETGVDCGGPTCPACPTCTDGVRNGQETGVDCGGPNCPACPTCTDGVRNGQETGVDCGGPLCPACPTCNDGIQNGQETGVDCGGPTCSPCGGGGGTTTVAGHYFETGMNGWIDGGSDVQWYTGALSFEGSGSVRLRDNSAAGSTTTSPVYNLSSFNSVNIAWGFLANSMEPGEDYWLDYFNGTAWVRIATLASGTTFQNDVFYTSNVTLNSGQYNLASNARFRFICDASTNSDYVYVDAVVITGTTTGTLIAGQIDQSPKKVEGRTVQVVQNDLLTLSPNPASKSLNIQLWDEEEKLGHIQAIDIYDLTGRNVMSLRKINVEDYLTLDVSNLNNGSYLIRVNTEGDEVITKKFIIQN